LQNISQASEGLALVKTVYSRCSIYSLLPRTGFRRKDGDPGTE
jgi:hypothetical protein